MKKNKLRKKKEFDSQEIVAGNDLVNVDIQKAKKTSDLFMGKLTKILLKTFKHLPDNSTINSLGLTNCSVSFENVEKGASVINKFLLRECGTIAWTNYDRQSLDSLHNIKVCPEHWEADKDFIKSMNKFKPWFIKRTIDNIEYGEIVHDHSSEFRHYLFRIGGKVKEFLESEGPVATRPGFWDPIYYQNEKLIAAVVSHEPIIAFNLTDDQKTELKTSGIEFDQPAN